MMIDDLGPEKPLEWISIDPVGRYRFRNNKSKPNYLYRLGSGS
jgi:hypothetical protein